MGSKNKIVKMRLLKDGYTFNPRVNARFHKENEVVKQKNIANIEISSPV